MEIALLLDDLNLYRGSLANIYLESWGSQGNGLSNAISKINCWVHPESHFTMLYYGNEFCEYCLPSSDELAEFASICERDNLRPVFVTSPVSDWGLERVKSAFEYLSQSFREFEVVVNDVGILEMLHKEHPDQSIIMGRLFDKLSHDSRILTKDIGNYYGTAGLKFARTPGILSEKARYAFSEYNICRYEFDLPKVGIDLPEDGCFSLYWPYQYLTTGRVCMMRAFGYHGKNKFLVGNSICSRLCKNVQVEMRKPVNGFQISNGSKVGDTFLFQKGNTVFYLYEEEDFLENAKQFDRLVLQI